MNNAQLQSELSNLQVSNTNNLNKNKNLILIEVNEYSGSIPGVSSSPIIEHVKMAENINIETIHKIFKQPPITASGVKNMQYFVNRLIREEISGHDLQLKIPTEN